MTIAYENGVNLFDTAEVYASGRSVSLSLARSLYLPLSTYASLSLSMSVGLSVYASQLLPVCLSLSLWLSLLFVSFNTSMSHCSRTCYICYTFLPL